MRLFETVEAAATEVGEPISIITLQSDGTAVLCCKAVHRSFTVTPETDESVLKKNIIEQFTPVVAAS